VKVIHHDRPPLPLRPWLMHQSLRTWLWAVMIAGTLVVLLMWRGAEHVEPWHSLQYGTWTAAVNDDAERLTVNRRTQTHTVRLLGVTPTDAPTCRAAIEALIGEQPVRLSFDARAAQAPGGGLAGYVYLSDGRMLNEVLLTEGAAQPNTATPHVLSRWFKRLSTRARSD
jgi:hypothetical protein